MTIESLYIYPIKGMKGTKVDSAVLLERGFKYDRRYMLVDKNLKFVSQRTHPLISMITPQILDNTLKVSYKDSTFILPMEEVTNEVLSVSLFEHTLEGTAVSKAADEYFSHILGENVRLIKMQEANKRIKLLKGSLGASEVSFADGYPYLIIGTASLEHLNSKLNDPIKMDRFRGNIIVNTEEPHVEDDWTDVTLGTSLMKVIKPCARCTVITIDQQKGRPGKEPLKTLSTYRRENNKIFFGSNAIRISGGELRIGDPVVIL